MFNRFLDIFLAALLFAFLLPLLAWYAIKAALNSRRDGSTRAAISKIDLAGIDLLRRQFAVEFNFERAIEAYEDLIDSTFVEGRP